MKKKSYIECSVNKKIHLWLIVIFAVIALSAGSCDRSGEVTGERPVLSEKITIAVGSQPIGALVYIAAEEGYFKNEGLDVRLQRHTSGKSALNSVIEGKADLATTAETPIMHAILAENKIFLIITIGTTEKNPAVIARKDAGISAAADLKGKKIGVTIGTNGEFFMDSFLLVNNILKNQVEVVNLKPEEMFDALIKGQVDAVSTWNPHFVRLQEALSKNGITFYSKGIYTWSWNLVSMQDFVYKRPETIRRLLRALVRSEDFLNKNSNTSQRTVSGYLQMDKHQLNKVWDIYQFRLSLSQSLLITLEDEARWAIKNNLTNKKEVPNYLEYIHIDALQEVRPEAVTIIQ